VTKDWPTKDHLAPSFSNGFLRFSLFSARSNAQSTPRLLYDRSLHLYAEAGGHIPFGRRFVFDRRRIFGAYRRPFAKPYQSSLLQQSDFIIAFKQLGGLF